MLRTNQKVRPGTFEGTIIFVFQHHSKEHSQKVQESYEGQYLIMKNDPVYRIQQTNSGQLKKNLTLLFGWNILIRVLEEKQDNVQKL